MPKTDEAGRYLCEKCAKSIENRDIETLFLLENGVLFCKTCINRWESSACDKKAGILLGIIKKWDIF